LVKGDREDDDYDDTMMTKNLEFYLILGLRQLPAARPGKDRVKLKIVSTPPPPAPISDKTIIF